MLVLSRKTGERILFQLTEPLPPGTILEVMVVRIGPNNTRLGLTAHPSVNIARDELIPRDDLAATNSPAA